MGGEDRAALLLIPADLRAYVSRTLHLELEPGLVFDLLEVRNQPRPNHWARVWPTSLAMSRWLLEQHASSLPASAVELGCGMALVSLTLAHLGVTIEGTDRQPLAIAFARRNALLNGVQGFTGRVHEWGSPPGSPTNLIVAADVIYEAGAAELIFELIQTAGLLLPKGRLVLGVPQTRTELVERLVARLRGINYAHQRHVRQVSWEGRDEVIDLHVLTRG